MIDLDLIYAGAKLRHEQQAASSSMSLGLRTRPPSAPVRDLPTQGLIAALGLVVSRLLYVAAATGEDPQQWLREERRLLDEIVRPGSDSKDDAIILQHARERLDVLYSDAAEMLAKLT